MATTGYASPWVYTTYERCSKSLEDADLRAAEDVNRYLDLRGNLARESASRRDGLQVLGKPSSSYNLELNFAFLSSLDDAKKRFLNRSVLDEAILTTLERDGIVNWLSSSTNPLLESEQQVCKVVALRTRGDGNCLLHGLSLAMWGVDDKLLRLRTAMHRAVTVGTVVDDLRRRWRLATEVDNKRHGFTMNESQWEGEWMDHIVKLCAPVPKDNSLAYDSLAQFHIFIAAQILQRPIVCFADEVMPGAHGEQFAPVDMAGLYLPVMSRPEECVKSPLMIAFSGGHFVGLIRRNNSGLIPLGRNNMSRVPTPFLLRDEVADKERLLDKYLQHSYVNVPYCPPDGTGGATFHALDVAAVERVTAAQPLVQLAESFVAKFDDLYVSDLAARCRTPGCDCFHTDNDEFCSQCSKQRLGATRARISPDPGASDVCPSEMPTAPAFPAYSSSSRSESSVRRCSKTGCPDVAATDCRGKCRRCFDNDGHVLGSSRGPLLPKCIEPDCRRVGNSSHQNRCLECYDAREQLLQQQQRRQRQAASLMCKFPGCNYPTTSSLGYCSTHQQRSSHKGSAGSPAEHSARSADIHAGMSSASDNTQSANSRLAAAPAPAAAAAVAGLSSSAAGRCASPGCTRADLSEYKSYCQQCMREMEALWLASRHSRHKWTCSKLNCSNLAELPNNYCIVCARTQHQRAEQQRKKCKAPTCGQQLDATLVRQYGGFCKDHFFELGGEMRCKTPGCRYFGTASYAGFCSNCSEKQARQRISSQQQAALRDVRQLSRQEDINDDDARLRHVLPCVVCHQRIRGAPIQGACRDCYNTQPGAQSTTLPSPSQRLNPILS